MVIYVAAPYSSPDESVRRSRLDAVNKYSAKLMIHGHIVFSPLSHSVPISEHIGNPNDSDFYIKQDLFWLNFCDEMHILTLPGWKKSKGIEKESEFAVRNSIKIVLIEV